jgi:hypothetical protein
MRIEPMLAGINNLQNQGASNPSLSARQSASEDCSLIRHEMPAFRPYRSYEVPAKRTRSLDSRVLIDPDRASVTNLLEQTQTLSDDDKLELNSENIT